MNLRVANFAFIFALLPLFAFVSCVEKKTNDPVESYTYWAGAPPQKDVKVIHGKYWQSAHWTREYILYMELQVPRYWMNQFVYQNNLVKSNNEPPLPSDAPSWFMPGKNAQIYLKKGFDEGSFYCEDTLANKMFIYEIQL